MKRRAFVAAAIAFSLLTPLAASSAIPETDEHVDCSNARQTCNVDVVWSHESHEIIRDANSKTISRADPDDNFNMERDVRYYYDSPESVRDMKRTLKYATRRTFHMHQEYEEWGEDEILDYRFFSVYYYEGCFTHHSLGGTQVEHMMIASRSATSSPHDGEIGGVIIQTTTTPSGEKKATYTIQREAGKKWEKVAFAKDPTHCDDPNMPFGLLKQREIHNNVRVLSDYPIFE